MSNWSKIQKAVNQAIETGAVKNAQEALDNPKLLNEFGLPLGKAVEKEVTPVAQTLSPVSPYSEETSPLLSSRDEPVIQTKQTQKLAENAESPVNGYDPNFTMTDSPNKNYPIPYRQNGALIPANIESTMKDVSPEIAAKSPILNMLKNNYGKVAAGTAGAAGIAGLLTNLGKGNNDGGGTTPANTDAEQGNIQIPYKPGFVDDQQNDNPHTDYPLEAAPNKAIGGKTPASTPDSNTSTTTKDNSDEDDDKEINIPGEPTITQADLQKAMQQRDDIQSGAEIGKGLSQLGLSIGTRTGQLGNDTIFDQHIKNASQPIQDLQAKMEMEKKDPNSAYSQGLKDYIEKTYGVKFNGPISGEDLKSTYFKPIADQYESEQNRQLTEEMKKQQLDFQNKSLQLHHEDNLLHWQALKDQKAGKAEEKVAQADVKRLDQVNYKLSSALASSRSPFGSAARNWRLADNIQALADQYKGNYNDIDSRQMQEIARSLDGLLSSGQATIAGTEHLIPKTLMGRVQTAEEYIANIPKGAQQGAFVKRLLDTVQREKDQASSQMKMYQGEILGSSVDLAHKYPEKFRDMMTMKGLPEDFVDQTLQKNKAPKQGQVSKPSSGQDKEPIDPKIQTYADQYKMDYAHAKAILESRGYGK